jgi:hypothetical protein
VILDEVLRKLMEPLFSGGIAVLSVLPPDVQSCGPAVLQWRNLTPEQSHGPETCCQKVKGLPQGYMYSVMLQDRLRASSLVS